MMIDLVFDLQKRDLSWAEKAVAICLATHINHKHPEKGTWVGISTIMVETSMSRSAVEHAMTSLRRKGVVVRLGYEVGRQARMPIHDVRPAAAPLHPKFASEPASIADSEPAPNADSDGEPAREPARKSGEPAREPAPNADSDGEPAREPAPNADELTEQEKNQREKSKEKKKASPSAQPASVSLSVQPRRHPDLKELTVKLFDLTGFALAGSKNIAAANKLLAEHSLTIVFNAFYEFFGNLDEFGQKTAIKQFFEGEGAEGVITYQADYQKRQDENRRLAAKALERALAQDAAELAQAAPEEDDGVRPEDFGFGEKPEIEVSL